MDNFESSELLNMPYHHTAESTKSVVDKVAHSIYPDDAPPGLFPVIIYGDGNCFPQVSVNDDCIRIAGQTPGNENKDRI